ncbi:diguanylate cyclase [Cellulomonas hominis]
MDWAQTLERLDFLCEADPSRCVAETPALLALARREGRVETEIELQYLAGFAHHLMSQDGLALGAMEQALALAVTHDLRRWEGRVLQGLAAAHNGFGDNLSAVDFLSRSLAIRRETGDTGGLAAALNNLADTYISMHQYPERARQLLLEAAELWPVVNRPDGMCSTLSNLAALDIEESERLVTTDPVRSRLLGEHAVETATRAAREAVAANPRIAIETQIRLARAYMACQQLDEAGRVLDAVAEALPRIDVTYLAIRYHGARGRLLRLSGSTRAAATSLTTGLVLSGEKLRIPERVQLLAELVLVHEEAGNYREALAAHRQYHDAMLALHDEATERRSAVVNAQLEIERERHATDVARLRSTQLEALNATLAHDVIHDPLTGLLNRRGFDATLDARLRDDVPLACVVVDLDLFKTINDSHSHSVGDEVLRQVARIMADAVRVGDVAARIGGEEFTLLLIDTGPVQARAVCERIRSSVAAHPWDEVSPGLQVTLSLGGAMAAVGEDAGQLFARADRALYAAKHAGRNRVRFVDETVAGTAASPVAPVPLAPAAQLRSAPADVSSLPVTEDAEPERHEVCA